MPAICRLSQVAHAPRPALVRPSGHGHGSQPVTGDTALADAPVLARSLHSRHVTMIAIGGIIGAGLFVGSSAAIAAAGPAIILSYLAAGLVIVLVMRMLSEMAIAHPHIGAFTEFARLGLGHWAGFVCGWLYWYFWVVVVAIEAIAGAQLLALWLPLPVWQLVLGLMVALTAVNLLSTRSYGEFEFWFASIKVAAILVFIAVAGAAVLGFAPVDSPRGFGNLVAHGGFAPFGATAVLAGVTTVIFSLCGAEIVTIAAAESRESARTISRLTLDIVLRILLFYVLSVLLIVVIVPWREIEPGLSPFATALDRIGIPWAGTLMNGIVLTAVLSCLNSGVYVTSRVLFTLAANGDAPQALVALDARRVPARAILIGSSFGYAAVIAAVVSPSGVFAWLVNASGAIMLMIYLVLALAEIRVRRRLEREDPGRLKIRMWLFPWASLFVVAAILAVLVAMALTPALASQLWASLACLAVVVTAWWTIGRRRHRTTSAPVRTPPPPPARSAPPSR
ncbi:MAG: amino acid permease [Gammaproteobacteria bacterium]|nr:amino acid permease [Gammaproteobacteria bacterium]